MDTPNNQIPTPIPTPSTQRSDAEQIPSASPSPQTPAASAPPSPPAQPAISSTGVSGSPAANASAPSSKAARTADEICWQAKDGQVCFFIKSRPKRWPQSSYPVLVVALRPKDHTRIQKLEDSSGGIEALFTYEEVERLVEAINQIAMETGKGRLFEILQRVPPKDPARKAMWDQITATRHHRGGPADSERCR